MAGDLFLQYWDRRSLGDLLEKMRWTMPPEKPGRMNKQQYIDIIAFILSNNKVPAGAEELGSDAALLNAIKVQRSKDSQK